jgi:hypothetical protein
VARLRPDAGDPPTRDEVVARLHADPSVRFSESGRQVLRWLYHHTVGLESATKIGHQVPDHWVETVAELARGCAAAWTELAEQLERRAPDGC